MDESIESLSYISEDLGDFQVISKQHGIIGNIIYKNEIRIWVFFPKERFFYLPVVVALILKKLNELNGYKRKEVKT